jgi:hypothetical protein
MLFKNMENDTNIALNDIASSLALILRALNELVKVLQTFTERK